MAGETRNYPIINRNLLATPLAALALFGAGCGSDNEKTAATKDTQPAIEATFASHGKPAYVLTYPGVEDTKADRKNIGEYPDGEKVELDCKIDGRTVISDYTNGDPQTKSDQWVRLNTQVDNQEQYAPMVYMTIPKKALTELPNC